jgi:hypothetical protein
MTNYDGVRSLVLSGASVRINATQFTVDSLRELAHVASGGFKGAGLGGGGLKAPKVGGGVVTLVNCGHIPHEFMHQIAQAGGPHVAFDFTA